MNQPPIPSSWWAPIQKSRNERSILIGSCLASDWAERSREVTQFRFTGTLAVALKHLSEQGRKSKTAGFLPTSSLRIRLALSLPELIGVDAKLGQGGSGKDAEVPAIETYEGENVKRRVWEGICTWVSDILVPWGDRNGLSSEVDVVRDALNPASLIGNQAARHFRQRDGRADLGLIVRELASHLVGGELFEGLGPCQLVIPSKLRSNAIDVMTRPQRFVAQRDSVKDHWYSMVARLSLITTPYTAKPYVKVSAMIRNWASRAPRTSAALERFDSHLFSPDGVIVPISTKLAKLNGGGEGEPPVYAWTWDVDDIAYPSMVSRGALPLTPEEAVGQAYMPGTWWLGVPELPALYGTLKSRTVFEGDERDLLDRVRELAPTIVGGDISFRQVPKQNRPSSGAELSRVFKVRDFGQGGLEILGDDESAEEEGDDIEDGTDDGATDAASGADLSREYREQNQRALAVLHGAVKPLLCVIGGTGQEQQDVRDVVSMMFGDAVMVKVEQMPAGVHGLRASLEPPGSDRKSRERFDARVAAWKEWLSRVTPSDESIVSYAGPRYALICAPATINGKPEDNVNYHAGIHALSSAGLNVHHCLPNDGDERDVDARDRFVMRVQSALRDVIFAHSGLVMGVSAFMDRLIENAAPRYVHGMQLIQSRRRERTQELDVSLIAFSRLCVQTGITELSFHHPAARQRTEWMPMATALRWLASQRSLPGRGTEEWKKKTIEPATIEWLRSVAQDDPRGLVLLDWDSLSSRLPGLRDSDLMTVGSRASIEKRVLRDVFPEITVVRVRRGNPTLTLRTEVQKEYQEAVLTGDGLVSAGATTLDSWMTTTKSIVEMPRDVGVDGAHFIASMGYSQKKPPLGRSCYRSRRRLGNPKKEVRPARVSKKYKAEVLHLPATDAVSIPASIEITVLSSPDDVKAENVARAVIGMRAGYAHYNAWTSLPAPLFFGLKIRDNIIRFPDAKVLRIDESGDDADVDLPGFSTEGADTSESVEALTEPVSKLTRTITDVVVKGQVQMMLDPNWLPGTLKPLRQFVPGQYELPAPMSSPAITGKAEQKVRKKQMEEERRKALEQSTASFDKGIEDDTTPVDVSKRESGTQQDTDMSVTSDATMDSKAALKTAGIGLVPGEASFPEAVARARSALNDLELEHQAILNAEAEVTRARAEADLQAFQRVERAHVKAQDLISEICESALCAELPEAELDRLVIVVQNIAPLDIEQRLESARQRFQRAMQQLEQVHLLAEPTIGMTALKRRERLAEQMRANEVLETLGKELRDGLRECGPLVAFADAAREALSDRGEPALSDVLTKVAQGSEAPADMAACARVEGSVEAAVEESAESEVVGEPLVAVQAATPPENEAHVILNELIIVPAGAIDSEDAEDEEEESSDVVAEQAPEPIDHTGTLREGYEILRKLTEQRRYALASLHVDALAHATQDAALVAHVPLLRALLAALDAIDCRFEVDPKLDGQQMAGAMQVLTGSEVGLELASPATSGAALLAASLSFLLFGDTQSEHRATLLTELSTRLSGQPEMAELAALLWDRGRKNLTVTREKMAITELGAREALTREIERMKERAKNWLRDDSLNVTFNHRGVKAVHYKMFASDYPLGAIIAAVARGETEKVKRLFGEANRKFEKPHVTIDEISKLLREKGSPDGLYRNLLIKNIEITQKFVEQFIELTDAAREDRSILSRTESEWLKGLYFALQRVDAVCRSGEDPGSLAQLYQSLSSLIFKDVRRFFSDSRPEFCLPAVEQRLLVQVPIGLDLLPSYTSDLPVCSSSDVLMETRRLSNLAIALDGDAKADESLRGVLVSAAREHMEHGRFLPAFLLYQRLGMSPTDTGIARRHRDARANLKVELDESRKRVARAMALGAINDTEAGTLFRKLGEIKLGVDSDPGTGDPACEFSHYPDLPHASFAVRELVTKVLDHRLDETIVKIRHDMDAFEEKHPEHADGLRRIADLMVKRDPAAISAANDAFTYLKQHGRSLPTSEAPRELMAEYQSFIDDVTKRGGVTVLEGLKSRLNAAPVAGDPPWLAALDVVQRIEALKFVESWVGLTASRADYRPERDEKQLAEFFVAIEAIEGPAVVLGTSGASKQRVEFAWSEQAFTLPPGMPPELGSYAQNLRGFVLRGNDPENEIRQVAQTLTGPAILLVRARLKMERRAALSNRQAVLIVDDNLAGFVAVHATGRLNAMMSIALRTFQAQPYNDYGGKPAPPEMFYGRDRELKKLRAVELAAVIYGGRRLGKSTLLDQILRDYAPRAREGAFAVMVNMDEPDRQNHVVHAWREIHKRMRVAGVLPNVAPPGNTVEAITESIEAALTDPKSKVRDLYLLLDETDKLMDCELHLRPDSVSFLRTLQKMCESLQRTVQVRYALAGLHNITRMTTEENTPLAKAVTIPLEPYSEPEDIRRGIELIVEPLQLLGFQFETDDLPWKIMSVCNFYPAFIQLYCRQLLEQMYNKRQNGLPPTVITAADLESVERNEKLVIELQKRFYYNLDLDPRYKAIALVLADMYYSDSTGRKGLSAAEVRDYCELFVPSHFVNMNSGTYDALLDEMRKLNMLDRSGDRYALRNPNIAMMMGDREKVQRDLEGLERKEAVQSRTPGERHSELSTRQQHIRFPMTDTWVRTRLDNTSRDAAVSIIVGNQLSGLADVTKEQREDWNLIGDEYLFSHLAFGSPKDLERHIKKKSDDKSRLIALTTTSWKLSALEQICQIAEVVAHRKVRIALMTNPTQIAELVAKFGEIQKLPMVRIEAVQPWSDNALYYRIREYIEIAENDVTRSMILEATGGFGQLVERICSDTLTRERLPELCAQIRAGLSSKLSKFYEQIGVTQVVNSARLPILTELAQLLDGMNRNNAEELAEALRASRAQRGEIEFLRWMGLVRDAKDGTFILPPIYKSAIENEA